MGMGDWIMATAQVKLLHARTGRRVVVVGKFNQPVWSEIFENNPKIVREQRRGVERLRNGGGVRPYIVSKSSTTWTWKTWEREPGEIFLTAAELSAAQPHAGRILIEPNTKVDGSNKAWLWERWQEVVDRGGEFVQVGAAGTRTLRGVHFVETANFRAACAVLAVSTAYLGTEGGLHHAAAALQVPAVVLFSEFIGPKITGYAGQRSIWHASKMCGSRLPCAGCRASMEAITVDEVDRNLREILA